MTAASTDPPEHLRVEVDELARALALIADDRRPRFQMIEPPEALPSEEGVHRRARETGLPGEDVRADPELPAARTDPGDELGRVRPRLAVNGARPIDEAGLALPSEAADPFRAGLAADPDGL